VVPATRRSAFTIPTPEQVVPADHTIRAIKPIVDAARRELDPVFDEMYSDVGRPSIQPENLLKACLLMALLLGPQRASILPSRTTGR
jgi:transposase